MKNITLEMSLKPFKQTDDLFIQKVCRKIFRQWDSLIVDAETVSILLWCADGSEILDYRGNEGDSFEWCKYIGGANPTDNTWYKDVDPNREGLHSRAYEYTENPPVITYKILKKIVSALKAAGREAGFEIRVGETFDVGPEFAKSDFKYNRHREICSGGAMGEKSMVCSYERLHGDNVSYASFPDGIPEGLPFGTFFGRQANVFLKDMGFDYIWFSNGLGFGRETWSKTGAVFDGKNFNMSELAVIKDSVLEFWRLFRAECPEFPVETRGTNMSLGIDMASDGVPLKAIYDGNFNMLPPANSPWAAINGDFGLELMGHMSRIGYLPGNDYLFRFYLHDPWWANSPWYDRYNSQPHDIYLPLSVARIDENGKVCPPTQLNILTIDNSWGDLPQICADEVIPHLKKAIKELPDDIPPVVWIYPFSEYSNGDSEQILREMYYGDLFIKDCINSGVPISAVVTTDNFKGHEGSIFISSIPAPKSVFEQKIIDYVKQGGKVIFFGSEICREFCDAVGENAVILDSGDSMLSAVARLGLRIEFSDNEKSPIMTISRSDNAFLFSVYSKSTTVKTLLHHPLGAPVLDGYETRLEDGCATYHFPKAEHRECRVFVEQNDGILGVREIPPVSVNFRRRISVTGLKNATVRFFGENYCKDTVTAVLNSYPDYYFVGDEFDQSFVESDFGTYLEVRNVTGTLVFSMPSK